MNFPIEIDPKSGICKIENAFYLGIGFGTYPLTDDICTQAVGSALQAGYHIIDTATRYGNFAAIAKALKGKNRHEIYIISKVWHDSLMAQDVRKDLESTLKELQTDYLDAYLIHWPNSQIPIEETLTAMDALQQSQKIRHIGLSNVSVNHLKKALKIGIPINWVQVEMHPYFCDFELLQFCKEHSIVIQAWSPLGRGAICEDDLLTKIGQKYRKFPAQVALRWIIQHGCLPLPSSKNEKHIRENRDVFDFSLSNQEIQEINKRAQSGKRKRITKEKMGFTDEFDFSYEECWPS